MIKPKFLSKSNVFIFEGYTVTYNGTKCIVLNKDSKIISTRLNAQIDPTVADATMELNNVLGPKVKQNA